MYVDKDKTNQNKYHRIILCIPVAAHDPDTQANFTRLA
jgi:hypothetical protein